MVLYFRNDTSLLTRAIHKAGVLVNPSTHVPDPSIIFRRKPHLFETCKCSSERFIWPTSSYSFYRSTYRRCSLKVAPLRYYYFVWITVTACCTVRRKWNLTVCSRFLAQLSMLFSAEGGSTTLRHCYETNCTGCDFSNVLSSNGVCLFIKQSITNVHLSFVICSVQRQQARHNTVTHSHQTVVATLMSR